MEFKKDAVQAATDLLQEARDYPLISKSVNSPRWETVVDRKIAMAQEYLKLEKYLPN